MDILKKIDNLLIEKSGIFKRNFKKVGPAWIENKMSKSIKVKKKGDMWEGYLKGKHIFNYDSDDYVLYSDMSMIKLEDLKESTMNEKKEKYGKVLTKGFWFTGKRVKLRKKGKKFLITTEPGGPWEHEHDLEFDPKEIKEER